MSLQVEHSNAVQKRVLIKLFNDVGNGQPPSAFFYKQVPNSLKLTRWGITSHNFVLFFEGQHAVKVLWRHVLLLIAHAHRNAKLLRAEGALAPVAGTGYVRRLDHVHLKFLR